VWEWVNDNYDDYTAEPKANPQGPSSSRTNTKVLRGGGWAGGAEF
jgi:formylglycine-generating enzyme required for sulfatase activity